MGDGGVVALLALAAETLRPSNAGIDIRLARLDGFTVVCKPKARTSRNCEGHHRISGFCIEQRNELLRYSGDIVVELQRVN